MAADRTERQELILTLISEKPIGNQAELLRALSDAGLPLTQSTLSRELKALGIGKAPDGSGGYRYVAQSSTDVPTSPLVAFVRTIERSSSLIVVKTPPGNAQGVARAIDEGEWPEVMGTIAGDDTILVICRGDEKARRVEKRLHSVSGR